MLVYKYSTEIPFYFNSYLTEASTLPKMSDPEEFYLNEFFSTDPPPDGFLLPSTFAEHFDPDFVHGYPNANANRNGYMSSGAMEFPGYFQADNDVLMSVDQTSGPTQDVFTDPVGDPSSMHFLESSNCECPSLYTDVIFLVFISSGN